MGPRIGQDETKMGQDGPRRDQDEAKMGQNIANIAKMEPRSQDGAKLGQDGAR